MRIVVAPLGALLLTACATTGDAPDIDADAGDITSLSALFGEQQSAEERAAALAEAARHPLGSQQNPIRAAGPSGQRAYLDRLRCSDGSAPEYQRGGSVGLSPYGEMMDVYGVKCPGAEPRSTNVYLDMYHGHVELAAVPGFTIVDPD